MTKIVSVKTRFESGQWDLFLVGIALVTMCLGTYLGNKLIGACQVLFAVSFLALAAKKRLQFSSQNIRVSTWFLIAVCVFSALSIYSNLERIGEPLQHLRKLRYLVLFLLLLFLVPVRGLFREDYELRRNAFLGWWLAIILAVIYSTYLFFFETPPNGKMRAGGFFGQVMTFAYSIQFSVLLLIAVLVQSKSKSAGIRITGRKWAFALLCIAGLGLYLTFTRGAVLGVAVGALILAGLRSKKILIGVVILGLLVGALAVKTDSRFTMIKVGDDRRFSNWTAASLAFLKNPVFGVGYRNFELKSAELKKDYGLPMDKWTGKGRDRVMFHSQTHAHNNYLEAFASTGVFGGLAFLGFCGFWWREVWYSKVARYYFLPVIGAFLVSGFFENTFTDSEVLHTILLIYFLSQVVLDWEQGKRPESESSEKTTPSPEPSA